MITSENPDYAGTRKVFGTEEISSALARDRRHANVYKSTANFWSIREIGETLHYHDGFQRYVRGRVTEGVNRQGEVGKLLLPLALVGNWAEHDLPRWYPNGTYRHGNSMVQYIAEANSWQPNETCIYEYMLSRGTARGADPRTMNAIDLSRPKPTPEQFEAAQLLALVDKVRTLASGNQASIEDFAAHYRSQLKAIHKAIGDAATELDLDLDIDGPAPLR
ncbi:hypothetical protein Q5692_40320, partial [Microcoleus sp. C2C3]|uniref:hypothetical protein n=1 Tax=Microcoleus sp. C2C3 TaxID=3055324 RepID=UPI002FD07345